MRYWFGVAFVSALGGAVGALFLWQTLPKDPFDWGTFLGALVAASGAFLLAKAGLREYFSRQERDEISRRWVDEGFTRVGQLMAEDFERERTNWTICHQLIEAVRNAVPTKSLEVLIGQLDFRAPALLYDHRRILLVLEDPRIYKAIGTAYGYLRAAHVSMAIAVPGMLLALDDDHTKEQREAVAEDLGRIVETAVRRLDAIEFSLLQHYAALARDFEGLGITTHAGVRGASDKLATSRAALADDMEKAIAEVVAAGLDKEVASSANPSPPV